MVENKPGGSLVAYRGIIQPFMVLLNPLSQQSTDSGKGYTLKQGVQVPQALYMDQIKLYARRQKDWRYLLELVGGFRRDINMTLEFEKCGVINVRKGKLKETDNV